MIILSDYIVKRLMFNGFSYDYIYDAIKNNDIKFTTTQVNAFIAGKPVKVNPYLYDYYIEINGEKYKLEESCELYTEYEDENVYENEMYNQKKRLNINQKITKERYVLERVKLLTINKAKENKKIKPSNLKYLIEQWEFDYEMDKLHKNIN